MARDIAAIEVHNRAVREANGQIESTLNVITGRQFGVGFAPSATARHTRAATPTAASSYWSWRRIHLNDSSLRPSGARSSN